MKSYFVMLLIMGNAWCLVAQKPVLDSGAISHWPSVGMGRISNDGKYVVYEVQNTSPGLQQTLEESRTFIQSSDNNWKKEIFGRMKAASFTADSKYFVYLNDNDSLCTLTLGSAAVSYLPGISSFQFIERSKGEWLLYQKNTNERELIVKDLVSGKVRVFEHVDNFAITPNGEALVLMHLSKKDSLVLQSFQWVNLTTGKEKIFWEGAGAGPVVFNKDGKQLAFIVTHEVSGRSEKSIWYYSIGAARAELLKDNANVGLSADLQIDGILNFSKDSRHLFFNVKENNILKQKPSPNGVQVDIWSYLDARPQSEQLKGSAVGTKKYLAIVNLVNRHVLLLEPKIKRNLRFLSFGEGAASILENGEGYSGDVDASNWNHDWNRTAWFTNYLVNTQTGEWKEMEYAEGGLFSPNGKYVFGMDAEKRNCLIYDTRNGSYTNITQHLPILLYDETYDYRIITKPRAISFAAWTADEKSVIIYDKYDLWCLDIKGKEKPINLTNSYGRAHHIVFRLNNVSGGVLEMAANKELILDAFNSDNKNSGFYRVKIGQQKDPELLTMGPYLYGLMGFDGYHYVPQFSLNKARDANVWLVRRESAAQSPNYFITKDFKIFIPISSVYPEQVYNWLTSVLINYTTEDGKFCQGVLYKPENFDSTKKYPVVIHYYETKTHELNEYVKPALVANEINIPWFVSRGYLVFKADIHYTFGETGQSAYNSIVGAARYLQTFNWVDGKHMGIQGHSFGGYETNYIVTHTHIFAAAMSSSGLSNLISYNNALNPTSGSSLQYFTETGQFRLGSSLWDNPDLYIKNSPIFKANEVQTPLLMMNNKKDGIVPFEQGVEFFLALRRLGKKVWMLQYDKGRHSLFDFEEQYDYTRRIEQFFDHYLKNKPAPVWMTRGIPSTMKGLDAGFEYDPQIKTPGPGLLIKNK